MQFLDLDDFASLASHSLSSPNTSDHALGLTSITIELHHHATLCSWRGNVGGLLKSGPFGNEHPSLFSLTQWLLQKHTQEILSYSLFLLSIRFACQLLKARIPQVSRNSSDTGISIPRNPCSPFPPVSSRVAAFSTICKDQGGVYAASNHARRHRSSQSNLMCVIT